MKILLLAPHPYYQERGTLIDVDLVLRVLSERNDTVDVLTYHEGVDKPHSHVTIHRIKPHLPLRNIKPNFSIKKVVCDIYVFCKAMAMTHTKKYDVIYALEEASFIAWILSKIRNIPFAYDMDSVLSRQMIDTFPILGVLKPLLEVIERIPIKNACMVLPVCDAIAQHAKKLNAQLVHTLYDIAPEDHSVGVSVDEDIRERYHITGEIIMYVGNLEYNQGIRLLLDSYQIMSEKHKGAVLVIIGGSDKDRKYYQEYVEAHAMTGRVLFMGRRPFRDVYYYLKQADMLVSSRTHGNNTPMKLYTYLASGVPTLVTDIDSHTQVINDSVAAIAKPEPSEFAKAMDLLLADIQVRETIVNAAQKFINEYHTFEAFRKRALHAFDELEQMVTKEAS